jgi:hypothetical protein
MDRAGTVLYDNTRGHDGRWEQPIGARNVLETHREKPLTGEQTEAVATIVVQVRTWAAQVGLNAEAVAALRDVEAAIAPAQRMSVRGPARETGRTEAVVPRQPGERRAATVRKAAEQQSRRRTDGRHRDPKHQQQPRPEGPALK